MHAPIFVADPRARVYNCYFWTSTCSVVNYAFSLSRSGLTCAMSEKWASACIYICCFFPSSCNLRAFSRLITLQNLGVIRDVSTSKMRIWKTYGSERTVNKSGTIFMFVYCRFIEFSLASSQVSSHRFSCQNRRERFWGFFLLLLLSTRVYETQEWFLWQQQRRKWPQWWRSQVFAATIWEISRCSVKSWLDFHIINVGEIEAKLQLMLQRV